MIYDMVVFKNLLQNWATVLRYIPRSALKTL